MMGFLLASFAFLLAAIVSPGFSLYVVLCLLSALSLAASFYLLVVG